MIGSSMSHEIERAAIPKIKTILFEYIDASDCVGMDRRNDDPNPFYSQTESGLFLEEYYGMPNVLWTPWGKLHIGESGHSFGNGWEKIMTQLLPRLGASVYKSLERTSMGEFGPVYALTKIDDLELPPPIARTRDEYWNYSDACAAWAAH